MASSPTELELAKRLLSHVHRGNRRGAESALAAGDLHVHSFRHAHAFSSVPRVYVDMICALEPPGWRVGLRLLGVVSNQGLGNASLVIYVQVDGCKIHILRV